jgi:glycosyltransferase involved in cell wall biosynthesis
MVKVCIISTVHIALDNRIFYREASSLIKAGYEVILIAVHDKKDSIQGINILPLKRLKRSQRPVLWLKVIKMAIGTKADVYHIHDPELLFISPVIRLFTRRPIIYDIHESVADFIELKDDLPNWWRLFLSWLFRWLEPALAFFQSGLIFADDQIARSFQRINLPKTTLYNYPLQSFINDASHSTMRPDPKQPIVLYLGGIKRNRGTALMLDAFKQVLNAIPEAQLFLVGPFAPESLENELRAEISNRNMSGSVVITGAVPFDQVGTYLAKATIGWIPFPPVPKYQKNIPTKLFEYMAYAIPIVSSDLIPVRPYIENRKTGLLVKADSPDAHAEALIELISNSDLAAALGKNAQEAVSEHYSWTEEERKLLAFYRAVLFRKN